MTAKNDETTAFLQLVAATRGHFRLESGHHGALWLDLDDLFVEARRIAPFVENLTAAIRPHSIQAVCGPLLGGAFLGRSWSQLSSVSISISRSA